MTRRKRILDDLDQEIHDHIERETQDNIERVMSPEEARCAALRKFGNVTRVKEKAREVLSVVWLEGAAGGCTLRPAHVAQVAGVLSCRSPHSCLRHWCEYRRL
jgi:hypothetical protein